MPVRYPEEGGLPSALLLTLYRKHIGIHKSGVPTFDDYGLYARNPRDCEISGDSRSSYWNPDVLWFTKGITRSGSCLIVNGYGYGYIKIVSD